MKYFTKELWLGHNYSGPLSNEEAFELSQRNEQAYEAQLEQLRPRLSHETYRFFKEENLHDGRLLAFTAGDGIEHDVRGVKLYDINARDTSVQLKVIGADLDMLYSLKYTEVRKVLFDFPSAQPLFHREGGHIGDWGYDELTAADDMYLCHEVLFASGATILIEFKQFEYEKEECEGRRYQNSAGG